MDFIDESEVLTPADEAHHIDKHTFTIPFVCGATDLGEALRRISEGAAMIRSKGEAGTGNVVEAVRHMRAIRAGIARLAGLPSEELHAAAKDLRAPYELVARVAAEGRLPVVLFSAGGIATPADAALMMQLGAEGVFVGSGIYKSEDPPARARAIVEAATHFEDPEVLARVSRGLKEAMPGIEISSLAGEDSCRAAGGDLGPTAPPRGRAGRAGGLRRARADARRASAPSRSRCAARQGLEGLDAIVIPGGESTTLGLVAQESGLLDALRTALADGLPALGTCAGMVVLARATDGRRPAAGRRDGHRRAPQRLRPPAQLVRDGAGGAGVRPRSGRRGLHPRALDRGGRRRTSRSSPGTPGIRSPRARARCW